MLSLKVFVLFPSNAFQQNLNGFNSNDSTESYDLNQSTRKILGNFIKFCFNNDNTTTTTTTTTTNNNNNNNNDDVSGGVVDVSDIDNDDER